MHHNVSIFFVCVCVLDPPDATISGYDENWYMGLEGAQLQCDGGGNPKPQNFTWTRYITTLPASICIFLCHFFPLNVALKSK